jgi:hypothetical protein
VQTRWRDARKSGNLHRSPRIDPDAATDSTETNGSLDRRYDWHVLRQRLTSPLAKRLYFYIDSHRGRRVEGGLLYERTIDHKLLVTHGIHDRNLSEAGFCLGRPPPCRESRVSFDVEAIRVQHTGPPHQRRTRP